jgi:hypothetical protein
MQRWVKSGKATYQHTSHFIWNSSFGTDYQENTVEFLLLKLELTECLVRFASRLSLKFGFFCGSNSDTQDFLTRDRSNTGELMDIYDRLDRMTQYMVADHPFWLELRRLNNLVDNMAEITTIPDPSPRQREVYLTLGNHRLRKNLEMVETQTGTVHSLQRGAAAFQAFAYASILTCFAGDKGRGSLYDPQVLKDSLVNYEGATRGRHYRLHILRFLQNLQRCQKKKSPAIANPVTDVFPPWRSATRRGFFYNKYNEFVNLEATAKMEGSFGQPSHNVNINRGNDGDRLKHLNAVQACIEQGFKMMVTLPSSSPSATQEKKEEEEEEDLYVRAMIGLVKCGVVSRWEINLTAASQVTPSEGIVYTPQPEFEFVVSALLRNSFDKEMIGAALNLATANSKTAWRFNQTLAAAECCEDNNREVAGSRVRANKRIRL